MGCVMSLFMYCNQNSTFKSFGLVQHHRDSLKYLLLFKGWLGYDKASKKLVVTTTANQDPLFATTGLVPILGIDVWEHAYYLVVSHSISSLLDTWKFQ